MLVKIVRMDHMGSGIGYLNDKVIFIPKTIIGDKVLVKKYDEHKKYLQAVEYEVVEISKDRIDAFCPYYAKCGGCHLQNLSYEQQLDYKKSRVANILNRAGITNDIEGVENHNPLNYRNKIELKIVDGKIGFYEKGTHELIEVKKCGITRTCINDFLEALNLMNINNGDVTIRCNYNDELLVAIKTKDNLKIDENKLPVYKVVGVVVNDHCIYGENHFLDKIGNMFFEVSYNSFFQVNSSINERLFDLVQNNTSGDIVLDLYSGVGTLSMMASKNAKKVYAIENIPNAVINALKNAKINNVENIDFILGNVEEKIKFIHDKIDTVIVDPPRSGLDEVTINKILELEPSKLIYISCETQKLTEDLKKLMTKYEVKKITILDMFSYTYHVECVCLLNLR